MGDSIRIVQISLNLLRGDGITHYVESVDKILRKFNIPTCVYAHYLDYDSIPDAMQVESLKNLNLDANDIIMYHMSIGCSFNKEVLKLPNRKILVFHNITPYYFMSKWDRNFENDLRTGGRDIKETVGKYDRCITFSDFNKQNLVNIGWKKDKIHVIPYFNYLQEIDTMPDPEYMKKFSDDYVNILFVGRVVPNKRQDRLISNIISYRSIYHKKVRLILAGNTDFRPYYQYIKNFIKKYDIKDIVLTSSITKSQLRACYESANIFLCLSEHEGFCMPIIEAMYMRVPVIALNSSAISYTMGGAGVLLNDYNRTSVSAAINKVLNNEQYRKTILEGQDKRVKEISNDIIEQRLMSVINLYANIKVEPHVNIIKNQSKKIAFVVQRYGEEVNGGAELECKMLAEHLNPFYDIEVITSCVTDYDTDINVYNEGVSESCGITIRRFSAVKQRNQKRFDELANDLNKRNNNELNEWIDEMGPCCPGLIKYLSENADNYRVIIFITYVFYTSIRGLLLNLKNAIFFPTAHDEGLIYNNIYKKCFKKAKGYIYNSSEEKELVDRLFNTVGKPFCITGVGIDIPEEKINNGVKAKYNLPDNYIVYAGRISQAKGCDTLTEYFSEYKKRNNNSLKLIITGKPDNDYYTRTEDFITYLGFISEEDKNGVINSAKALILPSKNESLSLVVLESMYLGRPVIVNGACPVLTDHCNKSQAGLYYNTYEEFETSINTILNNDELYNKMSLSGKEYVRINYNWDTITEKIRGFIETFF